MNDEEMSAEEIAQQFGESVQEKVELYPEETVYSIVARMRNLVSFAVNSNPTPMGIQLCNAYTHVLKSFYDFSHSLSEEECSRLSELIRKNESLPANFISSVHGGLVEAKINNDKIRAELREFERLNGLLLEQFGNDQKTIKALLLQVSNLQSEVKELSKPKGFWAWLASKLL